MTNRATGGALPAFRLDTFLPYRIVALGQAMGQGLAKQYADEFGLTIPEWRTLALIGQYNGVTAARVVGETPMDKATVSRAVTGLVERRLVERRPHAEDRRASVLSLSSEGAAVFAAVSERAIGYEAQLVDGLTEDERATLDRALTKLSAAAQ